MDHDDRIQIGEDMTVDVIDLLSVLSVPFIQEGTEIKVEFGVWMAMALSDDKVLADWEKYKTVTSERVGQEVDIWSHKPRKEKKYPAFHR